MSKLYVAQKGLILDKTKPKLLVIKYLDAKHNPEVVKDKLGLPGGRIDFGENPDKAFVREIEEETGIVVKPFHPFHIWSWTYNREGTKVQIVAIVRLAIHKRGNLKKPKVEAEVILEKARWVKLKDINLKGFIKDEMPIIRKYLEYSKKNPFIL